MSEESETQIMDTQMKITTLIITLALFFILTYIHYYISYTGIKGEVLVDDNRDSKEKLTISNDRIERSENNSFTYSCWFYIESFDYKKTQTKTIFYKGDRSTREYFPGVFLMPYTNNLKVIISEQQDVVKNVKRNKNSEVIIKSVPIKKWNHLLITMNRNTLGVYFNGYNEGDISLRGNIRANDMPLTITDNCGFKGIMKKLVYYDSYFSNEQMYQLYSLGPTIDNKIITYIDYLLRMLTAGLTFDYNGYPHNISEKKINSLRWLSTVLVCLILTLYFSN